MTRIMNRRIGRTGLKLSLDDQRRGFRMMALSSVIGFIGEEVFSGNILIVIALYFKATEGYIGLLWFFIFCSSLAQLFIIGFAQQRPKKKIVICIFSGALMLSLPVLGLEWMSSHKGTTLALVALAGCVGLRQIVYNSSPPSWFILLRRMMPVRKRGRWLGGLRTGWQSAVVLTLIATGLYLGRHPEWNKLHTMVILGLLAQVVRTVCLFPVPSVPSSTQAKKIGWWEMIQTPIREKAFRNFLLYTALYGLALGLEEGFRFVYLIRLGFGQNLALVCSSLAALGAAATLYLWGRMADRFGNHGVLSLTLAGLICCVIFWLFVSGRPAGLILAMTLFFMGGIFSSGNSLVQTRYLLAAVKPELEASYIAVSLSILQQATGVGALLGGQILTLAYKLGFQIGKPGPNNYHVIFFLSALLFLVLWIFRRRLKKPADASTLQLVTGILKRIRRIVYPAVPRAKGAG